MAFWLFKQVRGALREHKAKKAVPTTDDSYSVLETNPSHLQHKRLDSQNGIELSSPRASNSLIDRSHENAQQKEEAHQRNMQQWKLLIGLVLPNFLAAVDVTIVAPAIPLISSEFGSLHPQENTFEPQLTTDIRSIVR
jgi:hypothetical protein